MDYKNIYQDLINPNGTRALQVFQVCRFAANILLSIILVHSMDLESVGTLELVFFTINLFSFFWITGIKNSMLSQMANEKIDLGKAYFSFFVLVLLVSIFFGMVAAVYYQSKTPFPNIYPSILLFLALFFHASSQLTDGILLLKKKYKIIVQYSLLVYILELVIVGGAAYLSGDWLVVLMAFVVWAFAKWVVLLISFARPITIHFDLAIHFGWWKSSLYLVFFALVGGCMEYVDGVLVEHYFEDRDFAIFKYGAREFPLSLLLVSAVSATMLTVVNTDVIKAATELKCEISKVLPLLFVSSSILMFLSPYAFTWVYSDDFSFSAMIFNMYLLILVTRVLLPQVFLFNDSRKKYLLYIGIVELLVNISLSIILIPHYGMIGIVIATLVAYILEKVLSLIVIKKLLNINIIDIIPLKTYLLYCGLLLISFLGSFYLHQYL